MKKRMIEYMITKTNKWQLLQIKKMNKNKKREK